MRGWRRAVPVQSRLPLPWVALLAMVIVLLPTRWELAVATPTVFNCSLRPLELEGLGLSNLGFSAYSPRHGGASRVLLRGLRALAEVKRRGRRAIDNSPGRFSKETRLIEITPRLPGRAVLLGTESQNSLGDKWLRHMPAKIKNDVH